MGSSSGGKLLEVTSSGMTHSWGTRDPADNSLFTRTMMPLMMTVIQNVMPWRYQLLEASSGAGLVYLGLNFGELVFDWQARAVAVGIVGQDGAVRLQRRFQLSELGVGRRGEDGVLDFGPIRGQPEAWRVFLGAATVASVLLAPPAALLACACLSARKLLFFVRERAAEDPDSDSEEQRSGSEGSPSLKE